MDLIYDGQQTTLLEVVTTRLRTIVRRAARRIARLPAAEELFQSEAVRQIRKRFYRITPADIVQIANALDEAFDTAIPDTEGAPAELSWWVTGGWGVDVLLGKQTRPHNDVDIWIEVAGDGERRARRALKTLGYDVTVERAPSGPEFPLRSVLRHQSGKIVDLIYVTAQGIEGVPRIDTSDMATGSLITGNDSIKVPCASAQTQLSAHLGYKPKERDRHDVGLLCAKFGLELPSAYTHPRSEPPEGLFARAKALRREIGGRASGSSALLFLVPEAQELFDAVGGAVPGGIPAHITVLYPFEPPYRRKRQTLARLSKIAAATAPFAVTITELARWEITTYMLLEPRSPIRELTMTLHSEWPEYPPYGNLDNYIEPHMALAQGVIPSDVEATAMPFLPVSAQIVELALMTRRFSGRWRVANTFALGAD